MTWMESILRLDPELAVFVVLGLGHLLGRRGDTVLQTGDVVAISGPRALLVEKVEQVLPEVEDRSLLDVPVTMLDVFVMSKAVNGLTLRELADVPDTRGVYLRRITRSMVDIPMSTSGGALLAGLLLGYARTVRPTFGYIPAPVLWLMNTLALNVFIAIVGISAGPGFVSGLQQAGIGLFLWGAVATSIPLIAAVLLGHFVFRFHPAILFGVCAGVRTATAALGMIQDVARSKVPALGYGMPYAIGNTLLTIFGMAVVLLMAAA